MRTSLQPAAHNPGLVGRLFLLSLLAFLGLWITCCVVFPDSLWCRNPLIPWQSGPAYLDLRILLAGIEAAQQGIDPLASDMPYNYPSIWLWLGKLGLTTASTEVVGLITNFIFLAGMGCVFWRVASSTVRWWWPVILFCPPVMLALERANSDIIIFALMVTAVVWSRGKHGLTLAAVLVTLAAMLKIYPLAGLLGALPAAAKTRLRLTAGLVCLACGIYFVAHQREIEMIITKTPAESIRSYGLSTPLLRIADRRPDLISRDSTSFRVIHVMTIAIASLGLGGAFLAGRRRKIPEGPDPGDNVSVRLFQVGAIIFLSTYVMFQNWEYRLIFLLPCVPLLHRLAGEAATRGRACVTFVAIALLLWSSLYPARVPFALMQGVVTPSLALLLAYESGRQTLPLVEACWPVRISPKNSVTAT